VLQPPSPLDRLCAASALETLPESGKAVLLLWFLVRSSSKSAAYFPDLRGLFAAAHFAMPNLSRLRRVLISKRLMISRASQEGPDHYCLPRARLEEFDRLYSAVVFEVGEPVLSEASAGLRAQITNSSDPRLKAFLGEAVGCIDNGFLRAATVLAWSGAISHLCDIVFSRHLREFNDSALTRGWLAKPIRTRIGGFDRLKESEILQLCEDVGVFGKSVKNHLQRCLDDRNACGHPNDHIAGPHSVRADVEHLLNHVFAL
jgi:hypothetical protein